tara:strand:+ start:416 stop:832 length:417 start_codon:yes stop_codon:yes gene_type:complete
MKSNKLFTIDNELLEKLKEQPNQSKIVNTLLTDYFGTGGNMEKDELINKRNETADEIERLKKNLSSIILKIERIETKKAKVVEQFSNIPDAIIGDFHKFPNMDKHSLIDRFNEIYRFKYTVTIEEVKKAFKAWKEEEN